MKNVQSALGQLRRAVEKYKMIRPGDRVAVGASGGKDSSALLFLLNGLSRFRDYSFTVEAISVDPSFEDVTGKAADFGEITKFCEKNGIRHTVVKTKIASIAMRDGARPCSLCANMRRGALTDAAEKLGCGVLALGHHADDAAETFLMNLLIGGRVGCFSPVTEYENVRVIRPLIYVREREIGPFCSHLSLPVSEKGCPAENSTERARMKEILRSLDRDYRGVTMRIVGALERDRIDGWGE